MKAAVSFLVDSDIQRCKQNLVDLEYFYPQGNSILGHMDQSQQYYQMYYKNFQVYNQYTLIHWIIQCLVNMSQWDKGLVRKIPLSRNAQQDTRSMWMIELHHHSNSHFHKDLLAH
jgi:hypothetical protein